MKFTVLLWIVTAMLLVVSSTLHVSHAVAVMVWLKEIPQ